jgi:hypothetical protein
MISDKLKMFVSSQMKDMDVVPLRKANTFVNSYGGDQNQKSSPSIEQLKRKYFSSDEPQNEAASSDNIPSSADDDIEVAILKKKDNQDNQSQSGERTIIHSNKEGLLGSQG